MKQKRMFVVIISALVIMISLTYQGTYSYFTSRVEGTGNTENNQSQGQTNTLQNLIISESANVVSSNMIPGDSVTYTFTVQNPNNIDVCYNLLWNNTTNTFVNQKDLRVKLEKSDGTVLVEDAQFPATTSGTTMLLEGTRIESSTTDTFTLTVTYQNTDEDQTADMGKSFSGTIIGELGECVFPKATDVILAKGETEELAYDGTVDNNLRYIGSNPNNYVLFNNELWRIIGVFNNIDDGTGNKETRLKIIRNEPIGEYSWDNKASGTGSSTSSYGSNDWSDSALQIVLNEGAYWNRTSGECPYGEDGATTSCDFTNNGLTEEAKSMISNAKWNLGGSSTYTDATASMFYERERGTDVCTNRPTEWIGKIGLMYPSDYGYATSGESSTDRETCLNTELYYWDGAGVSDCKNNDWLHESSDSQWTLTPSSSASNYVFIVYSRGRVYPNNVSIRNAVSPALYLSSNVKISGGDGSQGNPYQLSL